MSSQKSILFSCLLASAPALTALPQELARAAGVEVREQERGLVLANEHTEYTFRAEAVYNLVGVRVGKGRESLPLTSTNFTYYDHGDWKRESGPGTEFVVLRHELEGDGNRRTLVVVAESRRIRLTKSFTLRADDGASA